MAKKGYLPLFVTRQDSRPIEASSSMRASQFGLPDERVAVYFDDAGQPYVGDMNGNPVADFRAYHEEYLNSVIHGLNDGSVFDGVMDKSSLGAMNIVSDSANEQSLVVDELGPSLVDLNPKSTLPERTLASEGQLTPPGIKAESNPGESVSPNARPERWIDHHDVEARFRRLEKLWESENTGRSEREQGKSKHFTDR